MTTRAEFATNFGDLPVPPELAALLAFQNDVSDFECYAEGFGLLVDDKGGLRSWSEDPEFLARVMPFAQANGSGSFYALWRNGDADDPSHLPVVVFGDEGGVHVVAEDVRGLLRLLAFDAEPMVDFDEVTYYKSDEADASEGHDDFVDWLSDRFELEPAEDAGAVVAAAQSKHKTAFDAWLAQYSRG